MLQFIVNVNDRYSIAETAQMAIEAGCKWIVIAREGLDADTLRESASELVPLCKESGVILTLENNPDIARDLGLHGVMLTDETVAAPALRTELGAEAIIGAVARSAEAMAMFERSDIDYAILPPDLDPDAIAAIIAQARKAGCMLPAVALGMFTPDNIATLPRRAGVNGIATSGDATSRKDPVAYIGSLLEALNGGV